jgi:hypothetical protein
MSLQASFNMNFPRAPLPCPAVPVGLQACFRLPGGSEHICLVVEASMGEMALLASIQPRYADRIVVYIPELGRFEGDVERELEGGFAIALDLAPSRRRKLAAQLMWFANRDACNLPDARRHKRIVPKMQWTFVRLPDGREKMARINDVSLAGVNVETAAFVSIGDRVSLGVKTAVVGRIFDGGFAAQFDEPFKEGQISQMLNF